MYLAALELRGFKSFAKETILAFEPGTTCVVGPNGSGKSAVADAIRWVLGEQSLKSIRAKRSDDVIFAGSTFRSRLGLAEVSLRLAEAEAAGLDTPELTLTRRIDRSGLSEYRVNGRPVRLLDLTDLLAKIGFAQKSYTVIPQGMIDTLVTASPQERRQMFEDATGVTPLLVQKERTERKLDEVRTQVLRARDLLRELEPRLRSLKRQANRARSRAEIEARLREAERQYLTHRWQTIARLLETDNAQQQTVEQQAQHLEKELAALDTVRGEVLAGTEKIPELERQLADLRRTEREQLVSSVQREPTNVGDVNRLDEEKTAKSKEREKLRYELAGVEKELRETTERQARYARDLASLNARLRSSIPVSGDAETMNPAVREALADVQRRADELLECLQSRQKTTDPSLLIENAKALRSAIRDLGGTIERVVRTPLRTAEPLAEVGHRLEETLHNYTRASEERNKFQARAATLGERIRSVEERLETIRRLSTQRDAIPVPEPGEPGPRESRGSGTSGWEPATGTRLTQIQQEVRAKETELQRIHALLLQSHTDAVRVRDEQRRLQALLRTVDDERTALKVRLAESRTRQDGLLSDARERLGNEEVARLEHGEITADPGADPEPLRQESERLREKLLEIGSIDPSVLEEEIVVEKRVTELRRHVDDLEGASRNLKEALRELVVHVRDRFTDGLTAINERFNHYFREVFGGGRASLALVQPPPIEHAFPDMPAEHQSGERVTDEERAHVHELPAGVEIHVHPPGKRVNNLSQLSGGEKALTSIALLCAILNERASPFVVLDEVDAALDEANSRRFANLLQDMAQRTQCIVITHNRATMEAARALYGVTMGTDGVSQLLSIKLEEAVQAAGPGHAVPTRS